MTRDNGSTFRALGLVRIDRGGLSRRHQIGCQRYSREERWHAYDPDFFSLLGVSRLLGRASR